MPFTRPEVIAMTNIKASKLSYYDSSALVVPEKRGNPKRPRVTYTAEQILELKIIQQLQKGLSLQAVRKLLDFLRSNNYQHLLSEYVLVLVGDNLLPLKELGSITTIIDELKVEAKRNQIVDFDKRIKDTILDSLFAGNEG